MNQTKRQPFILNLYKSIKDFDYYKKVSTEKLSKSFVYFFILIILYAIISTIGIVFHINKNINEAKDFISTEISNLNYTNGTLTINNNEYKSFFNNYIVIDTSKEDNKDYKDNSDIFIGKQYCTIKIENYVFKMTYKDYFYEDINKDDIIRMLSNINTQYYIIFSILILIITAITLTFSTLLDILIISLVGIMTSKMIGNEKLKFSNTFKIAIHAITLPIILSMIYYTINTFAGFYIKYFAIMYTSIATIYIITAILLITMDSYKKNDNNI